MNHSEIVSFIWGVADLIRDTFKRGKYQDVILPLTVLRRLDCVLAPTKKKVLETHAQYKGKLENTDKLLRKASKFAFYNTSQYDFDRLLADAPHLAANLRHYIAGFSLNMREVLEKFDFDNTITKLNDAGLLFQVMERFKNVNLHPDAVDNPAMGTIFEELIRKFNEAMNENPGEHFTPRDVVHLMAGLLLAGEEKRISGPGIVITVYDPCCGSGGMLTITKEHIQAGVRRNGEILRKALNPNAEIHLFGQEVNPETFAVCKSDLFMKSSDGREAEHILFGSTLSDDRHRDMHFNYLIANPPYGKDWKRDEAAVIREHETGPAGRFGPGLPRISDGQLLFLLHMIAHMWPKKEGGSRLAIIMNGSPLFTGDAGSGESEIRRWILERDLLEALIAVPEQLFYNTGIATYIWILTNRKEPRRKGKVQLIDATGFWTQMRKSLGDKRREIPWEKSEEILSLMRDFRDGENVRIYPTTHFGFRKITVERPLRLNFEASDERIERIRDESAFRNLAVSKKKGPAKAKEEAKGREQQEDLIALLRTLPKGIVKDRAEFERILADACSKAEYKLPAVLKKAVLSALSERDETAEICRDSEGNPEPDPELRDTESIPLPEGPDPADKAGIPKSVAEFFDREVKPHVPDAWIDLNRRDEQDGKVGIIGYEINFNRYFYKYKPPRPLEEIEAEIKQVEKDIMEMLGGISG